MEEYKYIERNIKFDGRKSTSSYKCEYGNKNTFRVLQIICKYGSECRIYEIESKFLKATSKSIHFDAERNGESFNIIWSPKVIVPYITRIK